MTSLTITRPRPVFHSASLNCSELYAAMMAAPYGDEFAALVAEWQMRVEWETALAAAKPLTIRVLLRGMMV